MKPEYLFFVVFGAVALYFVFQISTKGFRGALFGGDVEHTYGDVTLQRRGL